MGLRIDVPRLRPPHISPPTHEGRFRLFVWSHGSNFPLAISTWHDVLLFFLDFPAMASASTPRFPARMVVNVTHSTVLKLQEQCQTW